MIQNVDENHYKYSLKVVHMYYLEKNIRKDLRKRMPAFAVERIFWENSIPVDSRHNAKIHRLALSRKWTRLVAQKPKLGLPG